MFQIHLVIECSTNKNHYLEQKVQHKIKNNVGALKYNYETNSYNIGHRYLYDYMKCCVQELDYSVSTINNHLCSEERKIFRNAR